MYIRIYVFHVMVYIFSVLWSVLVRSSDTAASELRASCGSRGTFCGKNPVLIGIFDGHSPTSGRCTAAEQKKQEVGGSTERERERERARESESVCTNAHMHARTRARSCVREKENGEGEIYR